MAKFILGKNFGEENNTRRYHKDDLDTPYGQVFAYQVEFLEKHESERFKIACFPLIRNLPSENGYDIKEIGNFVPVEQRAVVSRILSEEGFIGEIKWQPGEKG
jgi:hypothetical protein